ncbi:3-oxoacyl-[acyl-carrier protein] reductase [Paraburkholderia sp. RAU2J]|uniref:SDR family oxidoreductase n=1 Tax=Paraburkholderia sp. RAU2J TaxID=1938810 RepID=UPI000EB3150C|nr:SDR family NAD(P)-dependent oxidoreductase [Paraburkholderia sp. RAU2J]RKT20350.1 3-oxoacyl-[acyl-carrier protein] reductase [Paraburkholderia sp. RAU2J]
MFFSYGYRNVDKRPEDRIAVVTGAARSLGYGIATQLHSDGFTIVMLDRDSSVIDVAAELGRDGAKVKGLVADLADEQQVTDLVNSVEGEFGGCDVLVNNAGINLDKPDGSKFFIEEVADESWELMMRVNLRAPFLLCRGFIPGMKQRRWGRIVNVTSRAGRTYVAASNVHYSAAKAGLIGMTRMLAGECGTYGITANCIAPGRIESAISSRQSAEIIADSMKGIPVGRIGTPAEVGSTVSFLASDGAAFITGATVDVNGGAFMG